ncbi:MAG TPA: SIR2 family protein [Pyrinomonadaceae bacterium]
MRVNKDPIASARLEFGQQLGAETVPDAPFSQQLAYLSQEFLKAPLVVFFDQFEEFFLHVTNSEIQRQFIEDMARIYRKRDLGVHVVFSMREEFFIELDVFRDQIPTIFHNDSNLRLRWFDREAATEAIVNPARARHVEFEPAMLERLLNDLTKRERIEPAYLQIVCDTLWEKKQDGLISMKLYESFDKDASEPNMARQIVNQRLEKEFNSLTSAAKLRLLEKLLPQLRTRRNTKHLKDTDRLAQQLKTDKKTLLALLEDLKGTRLIQEVKFGTVITIQLAHDYLAEPRRLRFLRDRVRALWMRRLQEEGQFVSPSDLTDILNNLDAWRFNREQAELLFRSALAHGSQALRHWYDIAIAEQVDVARVLREALQQDRQKAIKAIDLLRELQEEWAVNLLVSSLPRSDLLDETRDALRSLTTARDSRIAARAQIGLVESEDSKRQAHESNFTTSQPPYDLISERLRDGSIILFLGPAVATASRQPGDIWRWGQSSFLPTPTELAAYLAKSINFPGDPPFNLAAVAQYYAVYAGVSRLHDRLVEVYSPSLPPTLLHTFLARQQNPLIVLSASYDDLLEKAFEAENRPYGLLTYSTDPTLSDRLLWQRPGSTEMESVHPSRLYLERDHPIIYKLRGSAAAGFCITEDDHVDFLARLIRSRAIPPILAEPLTTRPFLFLGYGLDDWTQRTLLSCFERELLRRSLWNQSWAVQTRPDLATARFWRKRRIEVFDAPLAEFIEQLSVSGDLT